MTQGKICFNKTVGIIGVFFIAIIGLVYFSFVVSQIKTTTNSRASINCRNYNTKQCPTSQGCRLASNRCVADPNYQLTTSSNSTCIEDTIIQIMYYGSSNSYTAARVATGKKESNQRTLSGGINPVNITSDCTVKFTTCNGNKALGDTCSTAITSITPSSGRYPNQTCSQVCLSYNHYWCTNVKVESTQFIGCKNSKASDGYSNPDNKYKFFTYIEDKQPDYVNRPQYYKNNNNLFNCIGIDDRVGEYKYYGQFMDICCQEGCSN